MGLKGEMARVFKICWMGKKATSEKTSDVYRVRFLTFQEGGRVVDATVRR